jgi:rhodanese-related sulfurtransferase
MIDLLKNKGFMIQGVLHLSPEETFELCRKGGILVDVRDGYLSNFKSFDVDKVLYLPADNIRAEYKNLPDDECFIFADSAGIHSKEVVLFLKEKGFENIANLAGGLIEWETDGLPVKTSKQERLTGSCMCQLRRWGSAPG